jgi:hypothetical protein
MVALERDPLPTGLGRSCHDPFDDASALRASVDEVAEEDDPASRCGGLDCCQQVVELCETAVNVTDSECETSAIHEPVLS